ncbi:hypothetical protein EDB95_2935 [Dinghuibacter silviterrae]|uniref:Uncharacterized protein n=1 Tax=Dinghuibacter silviterrae TaxID=1539049 RepID=A0A4R8DXE8_9BACT|nr:hypothetical protein EDB95_2935 [Dinghuibacter silviterrae]
MYKMFTYLARRNALCKAYFESPASFFPNLGLSISYSLMASVIKLFSQHQHYCDNRTDNSNELCKRGLTNLI